QSTSPHALNGLAGVVEIAERPQAELSANGRAGLEAVHQPRLAAAPDRVVQDEDTAKGLAATVGRAVGAVGLVRVELAAQGYQFLVGALAVFRVTVNVPEPPRGGGPFGAFAGLLLDAANGGGAVTGLDAFEELLGADELVAATERSLRVARVLDDEVGGHRMSSEVQAGREDTHHGLFASGILEVLSDKYPLTRRP